ncbi:MAG: HlyC/CorC family transporter, partial [Verrucomicrobia bacterium]|nr:HlyC/CorC family transporter [Verrucomicrobiota bacterium]
FSLSSMQVKAFKKGLDPGKKQIAKLLSQPRELLVTLIILIIVLSLSIQNIMSTIFQKNDSWFLNIGVPLAINLILGEMIPKSLSITNNVKISVWVAPLLFRVQTVLFPLRKLLSSITSFITPFIFFFLHKEKEISVDELQHALKDSKDRGILLPEETKLIRGYIRLQEASVKELMRPREEVICFQSTEPLSRLVHLFVDQECTRIPLCEGSLDKLIGIVSSRIFFQHKDIIKETKDLISIVKKPFFVPEAMKGDILLRQFYEKKESIAVVVDEYGSITGIIAMEDLVEEVVGEITDRRDQEAFFTRAGNDVIIASGKLELSEFEEIFQVPLKSENLMVTIGGWLTEQLGDIPKPGTKYRTKEFLFHILSADPTRIRRVYIRRLTTSAKKHG